MRRYRLVLPICLCVLWPGPAQAQVEQNPGQRQSAQGSKRVRLRAGVLHLGAARQRLGLGSLRDRFLTEPERSLLPPDPPVDPRDQRPAVPPPLMNTQLRVSAVVNEDRLSDRLRAVLHYATGLPRP